MDQPVLAPYQPFLVMFPEILLGFQSTLPIINESFPTLPHFPVTALGLKKLYLSDRGGMFAFLLKELHVIQWNSLYTKRSFFAIIRISNMDINQLLKFNIFVLETQEKQRNTPGTTDDGNLSSKETANSIIT